MQAKWLIYLYDHLRNKTETIKNGFESAEIEEEINAEIEAEDPVEDWINAGNVHFH